MVNVPCITAEILEFSTSIFDWLRGKMSSQEKRGLLYMYSKINTALAKEKACLRWKNYILLLMRTSYFNHKCVCLHENSTGGFTAAHCDTQLINFQSWRGNVGSESQQSVVSAVAGPSVGRFLREVRESHSPLSLSMAVTDGLYMERRPWFVLKDCSFTEILAFIVT